MSSVGFCDDLKPIKHAKGHERLGSIRVKVPKYYCRLFLERVSASQIYDFCVASAFVIFLEMDSLRKKIYKETNKNTFSEAIAHQRKQNAICVAKNIYWNRETQIFEVFINTKRILMPIIIDISMGKNLSFIFVLLLLLLGCGNALNWQGTGELTTDNLTTIWSYISTNFHTSWKADLTLGSNVAGNTTLADFVIGFSSYLNTLWDPAWNVVLAGEAVAGKNQDSVLYGYSFRSHWLWYNGFKMDDNHYFTFVIWKDYNCISWITYRSDVSSGSNLATNGAIDSIFNNAMSTFDLNDIWGVAFSSTNKLQAALGGAFTVIASQSFTVFYTARVCVFGYFDRRVLTEPPQTGRMLVLQMR